MDETFTGQKGRAGLAEILKITAPVAVAYVPLGAALGVYLVSSGIAWYWAPVSAVIIYAGSAEFLAVSFILSGLPLYVVAWTTFVVNFRHIFYGLSFPLHRFTNLPQKLYGIWSLTDEVYGLTCGGGKGKNLDSRGLTILQATCQLSWVSGALFGSLAGLFLPPEFKGFDFALTAIFILLSVDAVRESRDFRLVAYAGVAGLSGLIVEHYLISESFLITGLLIYLALISVDFFRGRDR